jgi:branched-chain amino acid transport system substrate-binding protein
MPSSNTDKVSIITLFLTIVFTSVPVGYGFLLLKNQCQNDGKSLDCERKYVSFGEQDLINDHNPDINSPLNKQEGIENFRNGNLLKAQLDFQDAWLKSKSRQEDDPEAFIYFNNARYASKDSIQIAVSISTSNNLHEAKNILRGVAQAQSEINQQGGINNKFLLVGIADDKNDKKIAEKIANEAVKNNNILAVVGHTNSKVSEFVTPIYDQGKLVMVTPTSYALNLSNNNSPYIFKIVPDLPNFANKLNNFYHQKTQLKNLLICYDRERVSNDFKKIFISQNHVKQVLLDECDVGVKNFNPKDLIAQAKKKNADSLLLSASLQNITKYLKLLKANNGQLAVFSSPSLDSNNTLQQGKEFVDGMVLVIPWHPDAFPGNPFVKNAQKLWSKTVTWRTAVAYDATKVIIEGLKQSKNMTREELQQQLHEIEICGSTGNISFAKTGERNVKNETKVFITRVKKDTNSEIGYKLILDKSVRDNLGDICRNH